MTPDEVRHHFAGYAFGEPCTEDQLADAEARLGQSIPPVLRELYRNFDGFLGPANASFFWPLFERRAGCGALVEMNRFLRDNDVFPKSLTSRCLFYGGAGDGSQWGLKGDMSGKVILWDAEWGDDFEVVGTDIFQVWLDAKRMYDELEQHE